jgi:hypothetical protein
VVNSIFRNNIDSFFLKIILIKVKILNKDFKMRNLILTLIISFAQLSFGASKPCFKVITKTNPEGTLTTSLLYSTSNAHMKYKVEIRKEDICLSGTSRVTLPGAMVTEEQQHFSKLKRLGSLLIGFDKIYLFPKDLLSKDIIGVRPQSLHLGMMFTKIFPQISGVKNCGLHCAFIFTILSGKKDIEGLYSLMLKNMHLEDQVVSFPELFYIPECSLDRNPFYLLSLFVSSSMYSYLGVPSTCLLSFALGKSSHFLAEKYGSSFGIHPKKIAEITNQGFGESENVVYTGSRDFSFVKEKILSSLSKKKPVIILINNSGGGLHYVVVWGYKFDENVYFIQDTNLSGYKLSEDSLREKMTVPSLYSSVLSSPFTGISLYNFISA